MTNNQINYWKNVETERHNRALEQQGLLDLQIRREGNTIAARQVAETQRSNLAREAETNRSNLAKESNELLRTNETIRSNLVHEGLTAQRNANDYTVGMAQVGLGYSQLSETNRHNLEMETIQSNSNPWTTLATSLDKLFNPGKKDLFPKIPTLSDMKQSIGKAAQKIGDSITSNLVLAGINQPTSTKSVLKSVKQLPTAPAAKVPQSSSATRLRKAGAQK